MHWVVEHTPIEGSRKAGIGENIVVGLLGSTSTATKLRSSVKTPPPWPPGSRDWPYKENVFFRLFLLPTSPNIYQPQPPPPRINTTVSITRCLRCIGGLSTVSYLAVRGTLASFWLNIFVVPLASQFHLSLPITPSSSFPGLHCLADL